MTRWYCTLDAIKAELGITDTAQDARLVRVIPRASQLVESVTGRVFVPVTDTRTYNAPRDGWQLFLQYDDLLSVTALSDYSGTIDAAYYWLAPANMDPKHTIVLKTETLGRGYEYGLTPFNAITVTGLWGFCRDTEAVGTLAAAITTTTATTISVTSGAAIEAGWSLLVDNEQLFVTASDGATVTVKRGQNGTTAATHLISAAVSRYVIPGDIEQACIALASVAMSQAGRAGVSSMAIGEYSITLDRASIPATVAQVLRRYTRA